MSQPAIQKGTSFITVPDTAYAAALVAVGVPFLDYGDPCRYTEIGGKISTVWSMMPNDAMTSVEYSRIGKAFKDPEGWIKENPDHPFGYALAAVRNYIQMQELVDKMEPTVKFKLRNGMMFYIRKGTEKYNKLIAKGLKPE